MDRVPFKGNPERTSVSYPSRQSVKKADKLYQKGCSYKESADRLAEAAEKLQELEPGNHSGELEEIAGDILIHLSNIARLYKIPQEQILMDRVEDMIDRYEPLQNLEK